MGEAGPHLNQSASLKMPDSPVIVWIRKDLRLSDNPALFYAAKQSSSVIPVYIWAPQEEGKWGMGGAQQWWLHHSLEAFSQSLIKNGITLIIQRGKSSTVLADLAQQTGARAVFWNKAYEPAEKVRDAQVADALHLNGIETTQCEVQLLHDPTRVLTGSGTPYKVFTPFWRKIAAHLVISAPLGIPEIPEMPATYTSINSLHINELELLPKLSWADGFHGMWTPGEGTALGRLRTFLNQNIDEYNTKRDFPFIDGTSLLSPHLHFGEISPRTVWEEITHGNLDARSDDLKAPYLRQLIWREFSYHLIHHFPHTAEQNLRSRFDHFPWSRSQEKLLSWQKGETGYPIVDAGMRQLWHTGWMHNRVRMIVASFLTKHLLTHWLEGAKWFWDTLVDANLPNNTMGWQWAAGSGADAQPFFRIFNPMNQGKKFDSNGEYVRKWVPELSNVSNSFIHEPWLMDSQQQHNANVRIGTHYPLPIVDHKEAREIALSAYRNISN